MSTEPWEPLFTRSRTVVSRIIAGKTIIVPLHGKVGSRGVIYIFKGTGSLLWQLLEVPRGLPELIGVLAREYEVGLEQVERDVTQFVGDMLSVGLVEILQTVATTGPEMTAARSSG